MDKPRVAIIKTQGNISSLENALFNINASVEVFNPEEAWESHTRVILPGVGNISEYSAKLNNTDIPDKLNAFLQEKKNRILGICVGFQYLSQSSEEDTSARCLKVLPLVFTKLTSNCKLRVPHVGWNSLAFSDNHTENQYFTHSYAASLDLDINKFAIKSTPDYSLTTYSEKFVSFLRKENVYGIQSHPEKSRIDGAKFLSNFLGSKLV